jgi:glycosyltransferase involved in cell wall biosynthesis
MHNPFVSIVILNYNGLEYLKGMLTKCLDSVLESNYPNLEIIFVDNG